MVTTLSEAEPEPVNQITLPTNTPAYAPDEYMDELNDEEPPPSPWRVIPRPLETPFPQLTSWTSTGRIPKTTNTNTTSQQKNTNPTPNAPKEHHPYPEIHGWDTVTATRNINPDQLTLWREIPDPKILVYTWEPGYQPNACDTVQKLKATIARLFKIEEPEIGAPLAAQPLNGRHAAPWCFIVTSLPQLAAEKLTEQKCWPTPEISFFAIPFSPPVSPFICAIENLTYLETQAAEVTQLTKNTILRNYAAVSMIQALNPSEGATKRTLESIRVTPLKMGQPGGSMKLVWNLYADPPSQDPSNHRLWRQTIGALTFITALNGAGVPRKNDLTCTGCRSIDHPTGLCPFPKLLNWITPPTQRSQTPAPSPQQRSINQRGRGRGRGQRGTWPIRS